MRTKSPFYRRLFEKAGVTEDDLHSLADIAKLPFTFPADLAGTSYSLLCTSQGEVEKPVTFYSSGSTGTKSASSSPWPTYRRYSTSCPAA